MNKQELIHKLQDIEWQDFEVKEARAEIPKDVWETVSAFSNTSGWKSYYAKKPVVEGDFDYYKISFYLEKKVEKKSFGGGENVPENVPEDRKGLIVKEIKNNSKITIPELALILKVNEKTVKRDIEKLKSERIIHRIGPDKGGHWEVK